MSHLLPLRMAGKRALGTPEFTVERYAALCSLEEVAVAPPQSFATQTAGGWGLFLAASTGANEAQQLTNHETSWQIEAYDGAYARGWKAMFNACRGARAARILNKTSTFWIVDYAHQTPDPDPDHATEDLTENQLTEPAHGSFLEGHDGASRNDRWAATVSAAFWTSKPASPLAWTTHFAST